MHILAQRAIVNGLSLPGFAKQLTGKPWEMNAFDLIDLVGGRGKGYNCSLNEIANLCGIRGKLDTTAEDVAAGVSYLLTAESVTGVVLPVDAGLHLMQS